MQCNALCVCVRASERASERACEGGRNGVVASVCVRACVRQTEPRLAAAVLIAPRKPNKQTDPTDRGARPPASHLRRRVGPRLRPRHHVGRRAARGGERLLLGGGRALRRRLRRRRQRRRLRSRRSIESGDLCVGRHNIHIRQMQREGTKAGFVRARARVCVCPCVCVCVGIYIRSAPRTRRRVTGTACRIQRAGCGE
jgi:hypothetical protein